MSRVYITDYIDNPHIEREVLKKDLSSSLHPGIESLLVWHEKISEPYIRQFPKLKGIVRYGVGFDNVDLDYTRKKKIFVCNTPDYGTEEVCDTALAMILNIARGITRYDFECRNYLEGWQENTIAGLRRISDIRLGIIGAGRIGGSVAIKAKALRFIVGFFDPYQPRGYEKMLGATRFDELDQLLKLSDVVSIHTPLNEETKGMVDEKFVSKMRKGSSLVNTARGKIVKRIDVFYQPLKTGHLGNVALDVLPEEPPEESRLIKAWRNREEWLNGRLIINPHAAYYSKEAYHEMRYKAAVNAKKIINGQKPDNIVNGL